MALTQVFLPGSPVFSHNVIRFAFNETTTFLFFRISVYAQPYTGGAFVLCDVHVEYPSSIGAVGVTRFDIREIVKGLYKISLPPYDLDDDYTQQYWNVKVTCESIDSTGAIVNSITTAPIKCFWGGINFQKYRNSHFFGHYMPLKKKLFTWQPDNQKVDFALKTYATYVLLTNQGGKDVYLQCKMYFDDGSNLSVGVFTVATNEFEPTVVPTGFNDLDLHSHETGGKLIIKYEVWITEHTAGALTEVRTYFVDRYNYRQKKRFVWLNSLGGFDAILCTGIYIDEFEYTGDEAIIFVPYNYDNRDGERKPLEHLEQGEFTAATGWKTKAEIDQLRDALLTLTLAEDDGIQFIPVKIDRGTIRTLQSDQKLFGLQFKYRQLFQNPVYTSSEYDPTLDAGPFAIDMGDDEGDDEDAGGE